MKSQLMFDFINANFRKGLLIALSVVISNLSNAQTPQGINYQAVARNASGNVLANQTIGARFTIRDSSETGSIVYREIKQLLTNQFGLFTHVIGTGLPVQGLLNTINWNSGFKYLEVETDAAGGTNYTSMGASKMQSVPYALQAKSAEETPNAWSIFGNAATVSATHFIGTTSNTALNFKVNNEKAGHISSSTGEGATFLGYQAGMNDNLTDNRNTLLGHQTGFSITEGSDNTAQGYQAMYATTFGIRNAVQGYQALFNNTTGGYNTAQGYQALYSNVSASFSAAVGYQALYFSTGAKNTAQGYRALYYNTTGGSNVGIGYMALQSNTTGSNNSAVGEFALYKNTSQSNNTAIGYGAGDDYTFSNGSFLGSSAKTNANGYSNVTGLGYQSRPTASNTVRIGNGSVTAIGGSANWTNFSDGRFKKNVQEDVKGLDFITKLRPVTYNLAVNELAVYLKEDEKRDDNGKLIYETKPADKIARDAKEQIRYTGFIAQEVEQAARLVGYDFSGVDTPKNDNDLYGLRYAEFVVPLIKAVQELSAENQKMKADLAKLTQQNETIQLQVKKAGKLGE